MTDSPTTTSTNGISALPSRVGDVDLHGGRAGDRDGHVVLPLEARRTARGCGCTSAMVLSEVGPESGIDLHDRGVERLVRRRLADGLDVRQRRDPVLASCRGR